MKKTLILTAFLGMLFSMNTFAQGLHFGIKGGPSFSNYTGSGFDGYDFNSITNFHAGAFVELNLFETLSLQPELLYSTKGSTLSGIGNDIENKLGYLSIPVLARVYLIPDKFSIDFGPQASFLLSETENVNISDSKTFDFALAGGVTLHLFGPLFVQGRYNLGLTDVKPDANVKNSVIQLSAGLRF
ncbi:porin family protein [Cecembia rubra]|uniref:Outer membrane protein with beta-barrel domain n=1 Tax=Cecembia rubra TaxID=1485585 RepID=A0A2P8ECR3_9BACT|nr:porin family protein [Cecembia rubra]PSL07266.1 outer membrane protein with beta-barrel domain [Cecembia rubra]